MPTLETSLIRSWNQSILDIWLFRLWPQIWNQCQSMFTFTKFHDKINVLRVSGTWHKMCSEFQTSSTFAFTASLFKLILNFSRSILFDRKKIYLKRNNECIEEQKNYSFKMDSIPMLNDVSLLIRIRLACSMLSTLALCRW